MMFGAYIAFTLITLFKLPFVAASSLP